MRRIANGRSKFQSMSEALAVLEQRKTNRRSEAKPREWRTRSGREADEVPVD